MTELCFLRYGHRYRGCFRWSFRWRLYVSSLFCSPLLESSPILPSIHLDLFSRLISCLAGPPFERLFCHQSVVCDGLRLRNGAIGLRPDCKIVGQAATKEFNLGGRVPVLDVPGQHRGVAVFVNPNTIGANDLLNTMFLLPVSFPDPTSALQSGHTAMFAWNEGYMCHYGRLAVMACLVWTYDHVAWNEGYDYTREIQLLLSIGSLSPYQQLRQKPT